MGGGTGTTKVESETEFLMIFDEGETTIEVGRDNARAFFGEIESADGTTVTFSSADKAQLRGPAVCCAF
jgi:hypothetical protein